MATATELLADPELLDTEWNLAPLVDGDVDNGAQRQLEEASQAGLHLKVVQVSLPPPSAELANPAANAGMQGVWTFAPLRASRTHLPICRTTNSLSSPMCRQLR